VLLYLAPYMDEEQIRRFVGNITTVVIYHDYDKRFDQDRLADSEETTGTDGDTGDDAQSHLSPSQDLSDDNSLDLAPLRPSDTLPVKDSRFSKLPPLPPFDPTEMQAMGVVPQSFTVVRSHELFGDSKNPVYRTGIFNKTLLKPYGPPVPSNYAFEHHELRHYLLLKHFNAMMVTRSSPPISRLYETPRQHAIERLVERYVHKMSKTAMIADAFTNKPPSPSPPPSASPALSKSTGIPVTSVTIASPDMKQPSSPMAKSTPGGTSAGIGDSKKEKRHSRHVSVTDAQSVSSAAIISHSAAPSNATSATLTTSSSAVAPPGHERRLSSVSSPSLISGPIAKKQ